MAILAAAAALIAASLLFRRLMQKRKSELALSMADRKEYHCVCITYPEHACEAVKRYRTHRFLSNEAPLLPLPRCTAATCDCRYAHFPDRREDLRRNPYGLRKAVPPAAIRDDRRRFPDRRKRIPPQ